MNEFIWPVRVYYEDTDAAGVVYYANYLRFMERARTEWLRSLGFEQDRLLHEEGVLFAVRRAELDLRYPGRFNDELLIKSTIKEHRKVSMTFVQEITNKQNGRLLCRGKVQLACIKADGFRPCPIPRALLMGIENVV